MKLGACKLDLSDTSVMVPFALCFEVELLVLFEPYVRFHILNRFG